VRRYLTELGDHLADLRAEEEGADRGGSDAESAALIRLGSADDLAKAMIEQRQFKSWSARAPWAVFGLAPLLILSAAWFIALLILWSGWQIFLPGADTPFGVTRVDSFGNLYFQLGKAIYLSAPFLVGWCIGLVASRQRLNAVWPMAGLVLTAYMAGTGHVQASRSTVPGGLGHIRMDFTLGPAVHGIPGSLFNALIILSITALPYLIWRLLSARSRLAHPSVFTSAE
jgi:hypothetical protein